MAKTMESREGLCSFGTVLVIVSFLMETNFFKEFGWKYITSLVLSCSEVICILKIIELYVFCCSQQISFCWVAVTSA